ncbi:MAG: Holliday junction resolvase RuvX [Candidatus Methylopumilus sp.]|jgi:putative Holliday junction resolvase|nr:Holliday junction resolvase RuvX [Candidatus Methylopumilus sp.]NBW60557.1 Holliday junction resolvase RuvX [Methylophilaceae bacterium]
MLKCDALQPINNDKTIQLSFQGSVLAFDFGEKRVGVAHGEHLIGIAHPLTTIQAESSKDKLSAIDALVHEWQPSTLVVGLPAHLDGAQHELTALCQKFARRLDGRYHLPVVLIDERLSSAQASQTLNELGIRGRQQKPLLDQIAAQIILQSYFDQIQQTRPYEHTT